ncbi:MAG: hypothetical protein EBZ60_01175 [Betaproteobacteria bacterium]|nr:hypothetical protein [Betaproteobacteria bacterium]
MTRPPLQLPPVTPVMAAIEQSVTLAGLLDVHRQSNLYLQIIQVVLPPGLAEQIKAGPIDESGWCLLVEHNAAGAKLRQLLPSISAHLRSNGYAVEHIRVKVMSKR